MKKLALFDVDKTIYNTHSFFQLLDYQVKEGSVSVTAQNNILGVLENHKKGEIAYSQAANKLLNILAEDLKGKRYETIYNGALKFFTNSSSNFYAYFTNLLPKLKETHDVYIVTTNTQYAAEAIVSIYKLKGFLSSKYEVIDGLFTGKVSNTLADGKNVVSNLIEKYGKKESIAVGDSENDIEMFKLVEFPICINPSEELKTYALAHKWPITNENTIEEILKNRIK